MDVASLSHERGGRPGVARGSSSARDRRRPHFRTVRSESPDVGQGSSLSAPAVDRPAGDADPAAAVADAADQLQADYFTRLLIQSRRLVDRRIDDHRKAIAIAEAEGDVDAARDVRRMATSDEQERRTLDDMLDKLRRRFPHRAPGQVPRHSARPRSVAGR